MLLSKKNNILNEGYKNKRFIEKGLGAFVYIKKKKYFDLSYCSGTLILGHNSKIFKNSLEELSKKNISLYSEPNTIANDFAKNLKKINKNYEKFIFCNSGTESVFKALRIVKAVTKRNIIISVTGSWHGSVDKLLFKKKRKKILPISDGLNENDKKNIKFIDYNDIESSEKILNKFKNKISCIIIEPIQGCLPDPEIKKYLKFLSVFSKKNKSILIFDEIITGLRTANGSVQNYYNIKPDISLFGKSYGGGLPIGIIAINKRVHNIINEKRLNIFFGGTFSANALSAYVGNRTTAYLKKNKKIIKKLEFLSKYFQKKINLYLELNNIDAKVYRFQTMLRIIFSKKKVKDRIARDFFENKNQVKINEFKSYLFKKKILYPKNGIIFFSEANTKKHVDYIIRNILSAFDIFFKKN